MVMSPILIYIHPFWRMYFQNESNKKIKNNKKIPKNLYHENEGLRTQLDPSPSSIFPFIKEV